MHGRSRCNSIPATITNPVGLFQPHVVCCFFFIFIVFNFSRGDTRVFFFSIFIPSFLGWFFFSYSLRGGTRGVNMVLFLGGEPYSFFFLLYY